MWKIDRKLLFNDCDKTGLVFFLLLLFGSIFLGQSQPLEVLSH